MPIEEFIDKIKKIGLVKKFFPNETILIQGEKRDKIYFLTKGKVKISLYTEDGNEIILSILTPPNFFGEMALFNNASRSATVTSVEYCEVIEVGKKDFFKFMENNVETTYALLIEIINRLRKANRKIFILSLTKAEDKIKYYLKDLSIKNFKKFEDEYVIKLPTHADIGKELGLTRETVTKVLNRFYKEGLISGTKGKVKLSKDFFSLF